jgi:hypothetical protein
VAEESILSDDLLRQLMSVGEVDILVGLPTYNNAATIGNVVQVAREGLLKYFPRERVAILNADGGSNDNTRELVRAISIDDVRDSFGLRTLRTLHVISDRYGDSSSPGTAMHVFVEAADLLRARACAMISPESSEIVPEWMDRLLRPVLRENVDLVTPTYRRHRFEGILVTNLMYPMTRALYGRSVREPHPTEFACSDRLGGLLVNHSMWSQDAGRLGPEVCFTVEALAEGFPIAQTFLGTRSHVEHHSGDLVSALRQTVGPLFWAMDNLDGTWNATHEVHPVPTVGPEHDITSDAIDVDLSRLRQMFRSGVVELEPVLKSILLSDTLAQLQRAADADDEHCDYSDELWVKVVYEFASAYHLSVINRDHIVQALAPIYRGRAYQFVKRNMDAPPEVLEQNIEALCSTFERLKPYLVEQWTAQKRGK